MHPGKRPHCWLSNDVRRSVHWLKFMPRGVEFSQRTALLTLYIANSALQIFGSTSAGAFHIIRCTVSDALIKICTGTGAWQVFLAHRLFFFFSKKILYMYISKYMSHLIKQLYLICHYFRDVKGEKRGNNNNNNRWSSITWFACGRHERGRETRTLTLL